MSKYIGIDENNDWEGETFGYYFEYSEDVEEKLKTFKEATLIAGTDEVYEVNLEGYTKKEIVAINKASNNTYKERIEILNSEDVDWDKILNWSKVIQEGSGIYKGMPLKSENT